MSERQKVAEMTKTLVNMFPDSKNDLEKEKYYYDHNYFTFYDWEEIVGDYYADSVQEICEAFPHLKEKINACLN